MENQTTRRQLLRNGALSGASFWAGACAASTEREDDALARLASVLEREGLSGSRASYDLAADVTYLNHASIGTVPRIVRETQARLLRECESNPWLHVWGDAWVEEVERTRADAAAYVGCAPADLAVTHNTTEAFNLLAQGLPLGPGDEVLFSSLNHVGASRAWEHRAETRGFSVRSFDFPTREAAGLSSDDVVALHADAIGDATRVLVLPHVDNLIGVRHPVREIATAARARGVRWIAVDGAQSIGMFSVDVTGLGVDFYATSAHKWLQAPKGLGLFYAAHPARETLRPMWVTWGQRRWEGTARVFADYGTRDLASLLSLGTAVRFQRVLGDARKQMHHGALRERALERCDAAPRLAWRSPRDGALASALYAVDLDGLPSSEVFERMFAAGGFVFRPFETQGLNSVRLSPNVLNSEDELDAYFDALERLLG